MTVCSCLCSLLKPENFVWNCHYNPDEDIHFMAFQSTSGESRSSGDERADLHMVSDSESPEGFIIKCHLVSTVSPVVCCQILVVLFSFLLPSKKLLLSFLCYCILTLRVPSVQDQFNVVSSLSVKIPWTFSIHILFLFWGEPECHQLVLVIFTCTAQVTSIPC